MSGNGGHFEKLIVGNGYDAERHKRLLTGVELDHQKADCRVDPQWACGVSHCSTKQVFKLEDQVSRKSYSGSRNTNSGGTFLALPASPYANLPKVRHCLRLLDDHHNG